jgi:hypothetical protein
VKEKENKKLMPANAFAGISFFNTYGDLGFNPVMFFSSIGATCS